MSAKPPGWCLRLLLLALLGATLLAPVARAQSALAETSCGPRQRPEFVLGFKALAEALGERMGAPLECERAHPESGDTLQRTTTGLAFYRKSTNTPTFTNGWDHWALSAGGLVHWTGESIDPPAAATVTSGEAAEREHPILAIYYPWYDPWSFGARTAFQPALEGYQSDDPAVIERHVAQARSAGIDGFVVAWDGAGGRTDRNFRKLLDLGARHDLRATIYFETHNFTPGGPASVAEQLRAFYAASLDHPNLVRYQGRPAIFFWATRLLPLASWASIRAQVDPEHRAVWIAEGDLFGQLADDTFDGIHPYSIAWSAAPARTLAAYAARVRAYPGKLWVPTAMPGYDDTRLPRPDAFARDRAGGAYLAESFRGAVASGPDWAILVTSFNEWLEGHQIEPAREYGTFYLDLLAQLVAEYRTGR